MLLGPALGVSAALFTLGVFGVLLRRNAIVIFMCVELMLNAVTLTFVALAVCAGWLARGAALRLAAAVRGGAGALVRRRVVAMVLLSGAVLILIAVQLMVVALTHTFAAAGQSVGFFVMAVAASAAATA